MTRGRPGASGRGRRPIIRSRAHREPWQEADRWTRTVTAEFPLQPADWVSLLALVTAVGLFASRCCDASRGVEQGSYMQLCWARSEPGRRDAVLLRLHTQPQHGIFYVLFEHS